MSEERPTAPTTMSEPSEAQRYQIELPDFEGPLDLLLHLVKKHELSIVEIPISFITEQYLAMLDRMRELQLDVAGEYLLMAATLCHLKSRELVPPDPAELAAEAAADAALEAEIDPRQELIRRLLEYQKYKEAAYALGDRPVAGRNVWSRGARMEDVIGLHALPGGAPLAEVPVFQLIESLERVLARAKVGATHDVVVDRLSITDRINELVDRLEREGTFTFESCFAFVEQGGSLAQLRNAVVVTFLAILEMTRLKMVRLTQAQPEGPTAAQHAGEIWVSRAGADLRAQAAEIAKKGDEYGG
jgi:segregation and condensation protein A